MKEWFEWGWGWVEVRKVLEEGLWRGDICRRRGVAMDSVELRWECCRGRRGRRILIYERSLMTFCQSVNFEHFSCSIRLLASHLLTLCEASNSEASHNFLWFLKILFNDLVSWNDIQTTFKLRSRFLWWHILREINSFGLIRKYLVSCNRTVAKRFTTFDSDEYKYFYRIFRKRSSPHQSLITYSPCKSSFANLPQLPSLIFINTVVNSIAHLHFSFKIASN